MKKIILLSLFFILSFSIYPEKNSFPEISEFFISRITEEFNSRFRENINIDSIEMGSNKKVLLVKISGIPVYLKGFVDHYFIDETNRFFINALSVLPFSFRGINIKVRDPETDEYRSLTEFLPELPPVPAKDYEKHSSGALKPVSSPRKSEGMLSGKTVFISPGHGWTYHNGNWITQRGNTFGIVEDISNAETVSNFLTAYLKNAGAEVIPVRETALNSNMVIVDNEDTPGTQGYYEEDGQWQDSAGEKNGYSHIPTPYENQENPFEQGSYRYTVSSPEKSAKWIPDIPEKGLYRVFVTYRAMFDRAPDAVYTIHHAGGKTDVTVDMRHNGSTWVQLGEFYFRKGKDPENGSVVLKAESKMDSEAFFIADAVRFGGGSGIYNRGGGSSEKPRYEECSRYHTIFAGAPSEVYDTTDNDRSDDVSARSRFAAWENEEDYHDSVYVSWHSNAYNGTARGLSTYVYGHNDPGTGWEPAAVEGSEKLATFIHNQILQTVKEGYSSDYDEIGNGLYSAWFGELNPSYNDEMPSCLIEIAFHDNEQDASFLKDPRFRDMTSKATYMGILQYFANRDEFEPVYLPSPPEEVHAESYGPESIRISWTAPASDPEYIQGHKPSGYIVQKSLDGLAFDNGVSVEGEEIIIKNLHSETPYFFRVIAYNEGGRSFPSSVVATLPSKRPSQILVIDGFSRLDTYLMVNQDLSSNGLSTVKRMFLQHMNSFDYVIPYSSVFSNLGFVFDSAEKNALKNIETEKYEMIVWFSGEQSTADKTFTTEEQDTVCSYIENGGAFFVSGSEIGWDLVEKGSDTDTYFYQNCLNLDYGGDDAGTYKVRGSDIFSGYEFSFDDGSVFYDTNFPDIVSPFTDTGKTVLIYDNENEDSAGVISSDDRKVAALGFPFETITDSSYREKIMEGVMDAFSIKSAEYPDDDEIYDSDNDYDISDDDYQNDTDYSDYDIEPENDDDFEETDDYENEDVESVPDETDYDTDNAYKDSLNDTDKFFEDKKSSGGCSCSVVVQ